MENSRIKRHIFKNVLFSTYEFMYIYNAINELNK